PVRGVVKDVEVTTRAGVIPPNAHLMGIVPLDDQLLIEARISPRDVAYIHPGQAAKVKISAYDYAIFGGLDGEVVTISPDTIQDEAKPDVFYYRVFIRTETDSLQSNHGQDYPIVPGMIATVDSKTGSKTVWDYLMKPISKAEEALSERGARCLLIFSSCPWATPLCKQAQGWRLLASGKTCCLCWAATKPCIFAVGALVPMHPC